MSPSPNGENKSAMNPAMVILITPLDSSMLKSPIKMDEAMDESIFGPNIKDIIPNHRNGIIALETTREFNADEVEKCDKIGPFKVKCQKKIIPDPVRYGVIHSINENTCVEQLKEKICVLPEGISESTSFQIKKVERLQRKAGIDWAPSQAVKITFAGDKLPEAVSIGYMRYRVSPYVRPPLQCYNCQRIGHTAVTCKSKKKCMLCSAEHNRSDCPLTDPSEYKCGNCGGAHRANHPECPVYKEAKEVEVFRAKESVTFQQAKNKVKTLKTQCPQTFPEMSNSSYANMAKKSNQMVSEQPSTPSTPIQTEATTQKMPNITQDEFQETLKKCLLEILKEILPETVKESKNIGKIVETKVGSHFKRKSVFSSSESESEDNSETHPRMDTSDLNQTINVAACASSSKVPPSTVKERRHNNKKLKTKTK